MLWTTTYHSMIAAAAGAATAATAAVASSSSLPLLLMMTPVVKADLDYPVYFQVTKKDGKDYPNPLDERDDVTGDPKSPQNWDSVDRDAWESFLINYEEIVEDDEYKENQCEDRSIFQCQSSIDSDACYKNRKYYEKKDHKQSPVIVRYDDRIAKCDDRHEFHTPKDGTCKQGDAVFRVMPNGLYAKFDCLRQPILDMSRNPNEWLFSHIEIKTPGEHRLRKDNNQVYDFPGELHLVHTGTGGNHDDLGIIAVWLDDNNDAHNAELELYIDEWEKALKESYKDCGYTNFDLSSCDTGGGGGGGGGGGSCSDSKKAECCNDRRRQLSDNEWERIFKEDFDDWNYRKDYTGPYFEYGEGSVQTKNYGGIRDLGKASIRLQNKHAAIKSKPFDATSYDKLEIKFYMTTTGVEEHETLKLEFYDGTSYKVIKEFDRMNDDDDGKWADYFSIVLDDSDDFDTHSRIRFVTFGNSDSDKWYLDNIEVRGYGNGGGGGGGGGGGNTCTAQEIADCCDDHTTTRHRRLMDLGNNLLRGGRFQESNNAEPKNNLKQQQQVGNFERHPTRRLNYNCRKSDYFCPFDLYIQTDNPYYHRYYGSLTQPPCTENVRWRVMIDPLQISKDQMNRIDMLIAKYIDNKTCKLGTWGKPRKYSKCKVNVNRPLQYLTRKHKMEDCEKYYDGKDWSFESAGIDLSSIAEPATPAVNVTNTTTTHHTSKDDTTN